MSYKFRPVRYARAAVPVQVGLPGDTQLNAARILDRNPSRRELVIVEAAGSETFISGAPFTAQEGGFIAGYGGQALDTNRFGLDFGPPPLVLRNYIGELYAIAAQFTTPNLQLGELVDSEQSQLDNVIPLRMVTKFYGTGSLPVQGAGGTPAKILEPDPDGMRRLVLILITFGKVYLSTTPTPGDTRSLFQYGPPAGVALDNPFIFTWPYVPRGGMFATGDAGGHRLFVTEAFGR